jgi:hypothetical protein
MKNKEHKVEEFSIIFDKLAEARDEQMLNSNIDESDFNEIHESVQKLQEIQQSIETSSYIFFTRT